MFFIENVHSQWQRSTSDLAMAITRDVPELVEHGFMGASCSENSSEHGSMLA